MFLVALIFAVVFAALGFGISFLYEKFLSNGDSSSQGFSDLSSSTPQTEAQVQPSKKGQAVDIVIQDEELPADEHASQYYVGTNRSMLNSEDLGGQKKTPSPTPRPNQAPANNVAETIKNENKAAVSPVEASEIDSISAPGESSSDKQFVPVRNLETLYNASGKEAVTKNDDSSAAKQPQEAQEVPVAKSLANDGEQSFSAGDEQLDTLPDLDSMGGMFESSESSSDYTGEAGMNDESDFATGGIRHTEQPEVKDAELMAKAISTILTNEE